MNTKTFIKNIDDMTKRAFGKLYAEYPDFHLYTVLIYIDIDEDKNRAVCSVGFDDLENSLKRTKIWQDSLHSKDEAKYMDYTRTHNPQDLLLKGVENIECDDINVKEAVTALKTDKSLRIIMSATAQAQKFANMCENSALVVEFSKYYHGRAIYDITLKCTEEEEAAYQKRSLKYKILFALILLFLAYKFLF